MMSYAVRNDGLGWRAVNSVADCASDETFSDTQPEATPINDWLSYQSQARVALDKTSVTMERIVEGVALGTCAFTNADVVNFMNVRQQLRAILRASSGDPTQPLPALPVDKKGNSIYPVGT